MIKRVQQIGILVVLLSLILPQVASAHLGYSNPFRGETLYVDPNSDAMQQVEEWSQTRPEDANDLMQIASQPMAKWIGSWYSDVAYSVNKYVTKLTEGGYLPVMVSYNFPNRHCSSSYIESDQDYEDYLTWIQNFAQGIGDRKAVIILEPDTLAHSCINDNRMEVLSQAVSIFKSNPNTYVYIDAGHSNWVKAYVMASRLLKANIKEADGFSLNVSNFHSTADNLYYGRYIAWKTGRKHFVIDTGRNGNGSNGEWCNPEGRHIGQNPTTQTGYHVVDAFLWIKPPGDSDGTCNGGPEAGDFWPEYALGLVRN